MVRSAKALVFAVHGALRLRDTQVEVKVSFKQVPDADHVHDAGDAYGVRTSGLTYGWNCNAEDLDNPQGAGPLEQKSGIRAWGNHFDRYNDCSGSVWETSWDILLPLGKYRVKVVFPKGSAERYDGCKVQGQDVPAATQSGEYVFETTVENFGSDMSGALPNGRIYIQGPERTFL